MHSIRFLRSPAFWVIFVCAAIATIVNIGEHGSILGRSSSYASADDRPSLAEMATEATILREGATLNELKGRFRKAGDRLMFQEEGSSKSYKCLENVCLGRVATAMQNEDRKLIWMVSAKVTEFGDENFLLLEKAIRTR
jgi:hypothetical protein